MEKTIAAAKRLNKETGHHWFEASTMRFFNSKIESEIIDGSYFISSERMETSMPKRYTIRKIDWETGDITSASKFQQFDSLQNARAWFDIDETNEEN